MNPTYTLQMLPDLFDYSYNDTNTDTDTNINTNNENPFDPTHTNSALSPPTSPSNAARPVSAWPRPSISSTSIAITPSSPSSSTSFFSFTSSESPSTSSSGSASSSASTSSSMSVSPLPSSRPAIIPTISPSHLDMQTQPHALSDMPHDRHNISPSERGRRFSVERRCLDVDAWVDACDIDADADGDWEGNWDGDGDGDGMEGVEWTSPGRVQSEDERGGAGEREGRGESEGVNSAAIRNDGVGVGVGGSGPHGDFRLLGGRTGDGRAGSGFGLGLLERRGMSEAGLRVVVFPPVSRGLAYRGS